MRITRNLKSGKTPLGAEVLWKKVMCWSKTKEIDTKWTEIHTTLPPNNLLFAYYLQVLSNTCQIDASFFAVFLTGFLILCDAVFLWNYWPQLGDCEEDLPKKPVGRLSVNCRPSVDRQSADCWPTVGRVSTNSRPTVGRQSAVRRPTDFARNIGYLSADSRPTAHRQSGDSW